MKDRVITGLLLVLLTASMIAVQAFVPYIYDTFILYAVILATMEIGKLQIKAGKPVYNWCAIIVSVLLYLDVVICNLLGVNALYIFLIALAIIFLAYLVIYFGNAWIFKKELEEDAFRVSTDMPISEFNFFKTNNTFYCILYPGFMMFFMYLISHIDTIGFVNITTNFEGIPFPLFALLTLFFISSLTDTFAMLFGRVFGRHKLCPKISPKKSVEGALFGLLGGTIGALIPYFVFNAIYPEQFAIIAFWQMLIIGFIGAVVCQVGDLYESQIKRRANEKDAGTFLRSHGGVLDRIDSVIFCTPYIFLCLLLMVA